MRAHFRRTVCFFICIVTCSVHEKLHSQNLVPNHSFEGGNCPTSIGQLWYCWGWKDAYGNTSDYFNPCGIPFIQPPGNLFGTQAAADGTCYAGFRASTPSMWDYFEFPSIELTDTLQPCQLYNISFKVSRGAGDQGGGYAVDRLGVALFDSVLTTSEFGWELWRYNPNFAPEFTTPAGVYITDSTNWTTISGTYLAHGGEVYLVIGNFEITNTNPIWLGPWYFSAYYFIDDVHVEPIQSPLLGQNMSMCEGENLTLNVGLTDSVMWFDGSTGPSVNVNSAGTYWVTLYGDRCTYSDTIVVSEYPSPVFDLGSDTTLCEGLPLVIGSNVAGSYSWSTGVGDHFISPVVSGDYVLTVTENGCSTTDAMHVEFEDCIFVPSAFSPNGDGQNDVLYVRGYVGESFHFTVYDRWGIKVFETSDPAIGWDGMVNNQPGVVGVYMYVAEMDSEIHGGRYVLKGDVSLIR